MLFQKITQTKSNNMILNFSKVLSLKISLYNLNIYFNLFVVKLNFKLFLSLFLIFVFISNFSICHSSFYFNFYLQESKHSDKEKETPDPE